MKKLRVLSLMLALIILSSAFAITGNAAYRGADSIREVATVTELDDSVYSAGLDELKEMKLTLDTLDVIEPLGNYTINYVEKDVSGHGISPFYYYEVTSNNVDDTNIAVFKCRFINPWWWLLYKHEQCSSKNGPIHQPVIIKGGKHNEKIIHTS